MHVQWFPGHMAKTRRIISEHLKEVDIVAEIVDARIPVSSRNPVINELLEGKKRIILLNKSDLSDDKINREWQEHFATLNIPILIPAAIGLGIGALLISFFMNKALNESNQQTAGMMKMMQFIFPVMILWMARAFPSGLALYWAVSQIIQIFFNIHLASIRKKMKREKEKEAAKKRMKK